MREEIQEPGVWKSERRSGKAGKSSWSVQRRHSQTNGILAKGLPVSAVDAAFEDVDLGPSTAQPPHRIDRGNTTTAAKEELVEQLSLQLAALEAQCQHLQGLLNSAKI